MFFVTLFRTNLTLFRTKFLLPVIVLCMAISFLMLSTFSQAVEVGGKAPQIIAYGTNGKLFALSRADARPKVINFFWVKCGPCKEEIPLLAVMEKKYPHVDFYVIHAEANPDTGTNYDIQQIQTFISGLTASPAKVMLGSPRMKEEYNMIGMPTTYLLSADNTVEKILVGLTQTKTGLEPWLKQQPPQAIKK